MDKVVKLFAYGTLRSGFKSSAYDYITKYFSLNGDAKAKGILYDMGEYPVAVGTTEDKFIVGELYQINDPLTFDFVIAQLDDYEGLNPESDQMSFYERKLIDVHCNGNTEKAWVYWYCGPNYSTQPIIESGDVLDYFKRKIKA